MSLHRLQRQRVIKKHFLTDQNVFIYLTVHHITAKNYWSTCKHYNFKMLKNSGFLKMDSFWSFVWNIISQRWIIICNYSDVFLTEVFKTQDVSMSVRKSFYFSLLFMIHFTSSSLVFTSRTSIEKYVDFK